VHNKANFNLPSATVFLSLCQVINSILCSLLYPSENREKRKSRRMDSISGQEKKQQEQKTRDDGSKQLFLLIVFSL
jgi:hypothetical protein